MGSKQDLKVVWKIQPYFLSAVTWLPKCMFTAFPCSCKTQQGVWVVSRKTLEDDYAALKISIMESELHNLSKTLRFTASQMNYIEAGLAHVRRPWIGMPYLILLDAGYNLFPIFPLKVDSMGYQSKYVLICLKPSSLYFLKFQLIGSFHHAIMSCAGCKGFTILAERKRFFQW